MRQMCLFLILILFLTACQPKNADDAAVSVVGNKPDFGAGNTVVVIYKDFTALRLESWKETEFSSLGQQVFVYNPENKSINDKSGDAITIHVILLPENFTSLDYLLEQGIDNSRKTMPDLMLLGEPKELTLLGKEGKEIKFVGTAEGVRYEFTQAFSIANGLLYTITYTCPLGACNNYNIFEAMKVSLKH